MSLLIKYGNVLEAKTDAVILTIDGFAKGMEGNIARAFARKCPDVWKELEDEIPYPLGYGEVFDYEPSSECSFRLILIASTLSHKDTLTESAKKGIVRTAFKNAINLAADYGIKTIATAIMTGGWRLSQQNAFLAMTEGYDETLQSGEDISVDIYIMDQNQYETLQSIARGMGYR